MTMESLERSATSAMPERDLVHGYSGAVSRPPERPTRRAQVCEACRSFPCCCGLPVETGTTRSCACGLPIVAVTLSDDDVTLAVSSHQKMREHVAWRRRAGY